MSQEVDVDEQAIYFDDFLFPNLSYFTYFLPHLAAFCCIISRFKQLTHTMLMLLAEVTTNIKCQVVINCKLNNPPYAQSQVSDWNSWSIKDAPVILLILKHWITSGRNIIRLYCTWGCRQAFDWETSLTVRQTSITAVVCLLFVWNFGMVLALHVSVRLSMHESMWVKSIYIYAREHARVPYCTCSLCKHCSDFPSCCRTWKPNK